MSCRCCKPGEQEKKEKEGESQRTPFQNCRSDVCLLSRFSRVRLLATPWTAAYQAPPSMRFSRQEYWSGLPLPSLERSTSRLYIVSLLIELTCRIYHEKCWAGWSTSWIQDCQEKYQQPQICRWHHPYDRDRRRGQQRMRWLDGIIDSMDWVWANSGEIVKDREVHGVTKTRT